MIGFPLKMGFFGFCYFWLVWMYVVSGQDDLDYDFDLSRIPTSIKIKKCCPIDQVRIILPYYKMNNFLWRLDLRI